MKHTISAIIGSALLCVPGWAQQGTNPPDASAQNSAAMEQRIRELEDRVIALEGKIRTMESAQGQAQPAQPAPVAEAGTQPSQAPVPPPAPPANEAVATAAGQLPVYGGSSAASKALNPDVSVIGDFVGAAGGNSSPTLATLQPFPSLEMHESEIGLQGIIESYYRGDFFVSFAVNRRNVE